MATATRKVWLKGSFSCKWVKNRYFFSSLFDCICIQKYACKISGRNPKNCGSHVFLSRHVRPPDSGTKNFKRVFLETMFFKLACTITKEQLDIFQKFLYRIKLYEILNRITSRKMWKKNFYPTFLNKFDEKKSKFCKFCCNFCCNVVIVMLLFVVIANFVVI